MAPHADDAPGVPIENGHGSTTTSTGEIFTVNSPNVVYTDGEINTKYTYRTTAISKGSNGKLAVTPKETLYDFKVDRKVPKTGMMLVGWGGNNGTTVTAGIIANRRNLTWETKRGTQTANYYGSVLLSSTTKLGVDAETGEDINIPFNQMLPMVDPNQLAIGGWDISGLNLAESMDRAQVLEPTLKQLVRKELATMKPLPSIYYPDFIAANQEDRADNLIPGAKASWEHVEQIRKDIRWADL